MFNIQQYLSKFRRLTSREGDVKECVSQVVTEHANTTISTDHISIRGKYVFLNTHPLIKNEIVVRKQKILKDINDRSQFPVSDIR